MDSWFHGLMDSWFHGLMDSWIHGFMDSWIHGFGGRILKIHFSERKDYGENLPNIVKD